MGTFFLTKAVGLVNSPKKSGAFDPRGSSINAYTGRCDRTAYARKCRRLGIRLRNRRVGITTESVAAHAQDMRSDTRVEAEGRYDQRVAIESLWQTGAVILAFGTVSTWTKHVYKTVCLAVEKRQRQSAGLIDTAASLGGGGMRIRFGRCSN